MAFFIGVDGGATKCTVRIEDESGNLLGRETSGPANIGLSVEQAWQSIYTALNKALQSCGISLDKQYQFHMCVGIAGCEVETAYRDFTNHLDYKNVFTSLMVTSDAHIACLGAHGGKDGAIIIAGTGVVGYQIYKEQVKKVSGWGFPHDDEGGGAWIGLEAVKQTLRWLDGRQKKTKLIEIIFNYFQSDKDQLIHWANRANSTAYASLAPLVIQQCKAGEENAIALIQQAAKAIDLVWETLTADLPTESKLPCAFIGGITPFLNPYLNSNLRSHLRPSLASPDAGAAFLIREQVAKIKEKL